MSHPAANSDMRALPKAVYLLAFVSFFNDVASDMVIPLLPLLLAGPVGGGAIALGAMEGSADAIAALMRLWSGRRSDRASGGRKPFALAGYTLSNLVRPALALAPVWWGLLLLRAVDRVGKGVRSAPRDALLAELVVPQQRGEAFGLHRAFDNAGAVVGALVAAGALSLPGAQIRSVVLWSAVPGALAVLLLAVGVREPRQTAASPSPAPSDPASPLVDPIRATVSLAVSPTVSPALASTALTPALRSYLWALLVFALSRLSETFIVLRGSEMGLAPATLLVVWAGLNACKALTARFGGILADRQGTLWVLRRSWVGAALTSLALAWAPDAAWLIAIALLGSLPAGFGEGAERAHIADLADPGQRGAAYGWYNLTTGVAAIPAGVLFGGLWQTAGAPTAFLTAALIGGLALLLLPAAPASRAPAVSF